MKTKVIYINLSLICACAFLFMLIFSEQKLVSNINIRLQLYVFHFSDGFWETFFKAITQIGSGNFCFTVTILVMAVLLVKKQYLLFALVPLNLLGVRYFNAWLKSLCAKPRPDNVMHLIDAHYYGFPSGHAMNSIAFFGLLAFIAVKFISGKRSKLVVWLVTGILVFLIGMSRVFLGVHYPIDVVAGFFAGAGWLFLILSIYARREPL